ncbi:MAG: hypothetical protein IT562_13840 [Alphaproteobacteria bacterium]|nr:hypothetical protein [Alphaproteobacteria bacterium]
MDAKQFRASTGKAAPPAGLSDALQALWWDAKGDWAKAHAHAQAQDDRVGAWVHAYLHRKEGDLSNAGYWYRQAGKKRPDGTLDDEWDRMAGALLKE